jgi:hypothetical protein
MKTLVLTLCFAALIGIAYAELNKPLAKALNRVSANKQRVVETEPRFEGVGAACKSPRTIYNDWAGAWFYKDTKRAKWDGMCRLLSRGLFVPELCSFISWYKEWWLTARDHAARISAGLSAINTYVRIGGASEINMGDPLRNEIKTACGYTDDDAPDKFLGDNGAVKNGVTAFPATCFDSLVTHTFAEMKRAICDGTDTPRRAKYAKAIVDEECTACGTDWDSGSG